MAGRSLRRPKVITIRGRGKGVPAVQDDSGDGDGHQPVRGSRPRGRPPSRRGGRGRDRSNTEVY